MLWLFFAFLCLVGVIGISIWKSAHNTKLERMRVNGKNKGMNEADVEALVSAEAFLLPGWVRTGVVVIGILFLGLGTFNKVFFYAEPGFVYHVRTIAGEERVVDSVGYSYYLFGRYNAWKKAMTVQAGAVGTTAKTAETQSAETDSNLTSANLQPLNVVMLDQVDSLLSATTRFRIPTDEETFLTMAHEYRTPDNLLRAALVPAFKETLQATGSLMAAEEYYSGRRTEFNAEFENQMQDGIYLVSRHEVVVPDETAPAVATADGSADGGPVLTTGSATKIKFEVTKKLDSDGIPVRKTQGFTNFGITVVEARVTDLKPNKKFIERMQLKQQASADRAIAREKRIQEVEQKHLAIAKGDREVAEEQAAAKRVQIKATTEAETSKRLVVIAANKQLEQARIDKQTAQVQKEKAEIDAEKITILAEADKYKREARIAGDNALQQKLDAEVKIQKVWAEAYARRAVPQTVIGSGGDTPTGGDSETTRFMQLMTIEAAKRLAYDRGVPAAVESK